MAFRSAILILLLWTCDTYRAEDIDKQWTRLEHNFRRLINGGYRRLEPFLATIFSQASKNCSRDLNRLSNGITNMEPWAFTMLDASAKPTDGMISGSLTSLGSYDQCIDSQIPSSDSLHPNFGGQYCTIKIKPPLPPRPKKYRLDKPLENFSNVSSNNSILASASRMAQVFYYVSFRYGICLPSTCNGKDVESFARKAGEIFRLNITIPQCETKQHFTMQTFQILPAVFIGLLLSMNIIGTSTYLCKMRARRDNYDDNVKANEFLQNFNIFRNGKKILDTTRSSGSLDILHGMKFLTITWIILGHTYSNTNFELVRSVLSLPKIPDSFPFTVIMNGTLSVDSFFFISGLLVTYTVMKKCKELKTINIPLFVFHRYWRIAPVLIITICILFFVPWMGSGPLWHELVDKEITACRRNWWTNVLFINNFVSLDESCLEHTWFLACDFQFYILSIPVLLLLLRWPIIGMIVNLILIILSMVITGYITYVRNFTPTILIIYSDSEFRKNLNHQLYFKPYAHAGPYFVGFAVGYFVEKYSALKTTKRVNVFGWLVAIGFSCLSLYGVYDWNRGYLPGTFITVLYASTHRTAWALGLAWLTIMCCTENGGFVAKLLSWKALIPLSRCTFIAYLIHIHVQMHYVARSRAMVFADHQVYIWLFFGNLVISFVLSFVGTVLFEVPLRSLEKHLLTFSIKRKSSSFTLPRSETKIESNSGKEMSYC
ncbi:nose resistant to fluoxetine protein 6-like [Centruroides vittatus]|uniref:nose resistant to fluoxetine protein 6-like n=1 Tax=Centruroides vittatus TaxID=120091 RepID=UPI003510A54A